MATKKPRTTTEALNKLAAAEQKRAHAQVLSRLNDPIGAHFERHDAAQAGRRGPGRPRHAGSAPRAAWWRGSHPHPVSGPG